MRAMTAMALAGCLLGLMPAHAAELQRFEDRHVFDLEFARDPQIAPDGRSIVYERVSMDIMKDRAVPSLWQVDADGTLHRPLLAGRAAGQPRWSPDGTRIAYVATEEGRPQIQIRWMDTGQTLVVTRLVETPDDIAWSPDGKWIAFTMRVPADTKPLAAMPKKPDGAEWAPPARLVEGMIYRLNGQGYVEPGHDQLFVVPAEGGTPRRLTDGDYDSLGTPAWTPDGSALIFTSNRRPDWEKAPDNTELYEVTLADGTIRPLTDRLGPDEDPAVSPDGRFVAYVGHDDRDQRYASRQLYLLDRRTGQTRSLTADLDREVANPTWSGDSRHLFATYEDRGLTKLARFSLEGEREIWAEDVGGDGIGSPLTNGSFSVSGKGRVAYTLASPHRPADVAVMAKAGTAQKLTHLNEDLLGRVTLGKVEEIRYASSADGREIQGWIVYPPDFDPARKYPLLLEIHGGPWAAYGPRFTVGMQLWAAAGYVVLFTNPRGSTGYGDEFTNQIFRAYPGQDYDDLISGVDAVIAKGFIDPAQLFVTGGSGGGTLTAWIVGRTDRFKAAVVANPVINWTSFALTTDVYNRSFLRLWFAGHPWEQPEEYWKLSPLSLVGQVKTPTLLITGEADYRTPIAETEQYYQALKLRGVDTAMVRIPEAAHGMAGRPSNLIARSNHITAWFNRYRDGTAGK